MALPFNLGGDTVREVQPDAIKEKKGFLGGIKLPKIPALSAFGALLGGGQGRDLEPLERSGNGGGSRNAVFIGLLIVGVLALAFYLYKRKK